MCGPSDGAALHSFDFRPVRAARIRRVVGWSVLSTAVATTSSASKKVAETTVAPTKAPAKKASKTSAAKKTAAKKAPAKKAAAKKAPAKKAAAKKAPAKKAPAKKTAAKKAPAKKTAAKKAPAKKTAAKRAPGAKATATSAPPKKAAAKKTVTTKSAATKAPAKKASKKKAAEPVVSSMPPRKLSAKKLAADAKGPAPKLVIPAWLKDKKWLKQQRALLLEERLTYTHNAESLAAEAAALMADREPGDVQFDEESGEGDTLAVERDRDLALSAKAREKVDEIDEALKRLDAGVYGVCVSGEDIIPKERLEALAMAPKCVRHQTQMF